MIGNKFTFLYYDLFRYGPKPYVEGVPGTARSMLPDWIGMVPGLEDLPNKTIDVIDEAYLHYHDRESLAQESKSMWQVINLSRQKEQTIIFVTQVLAYVNLDEGWKQRMIAALTDNGGITEAKDNQVQVLLNI